MEIAEQIVPFGEHAATLRMLFLGYAMQAAFGGSKQAGVWAERIRHQLFSTKPKRRRNPVAALLGRLAGKKNR
jgi:hypothetical protein